MIYFVSAQRELFSNDVYSLISVSESLKILETWDMIQFDTETTGLDPHIDTVLMAQFGNIEGTIQIIVDCTDRKSVV